MRNARVKALGDGLIDQGAAFLLMQLDKPLLLRHQRIHLICLPLEERYAGPLLVIGGAQDRAFA